MDIQYIEDGYYFKGEFCMIGPFKTESECKRLQKLYKECGESQDKFDDYMHDALRGDVGI